MRALEGNQAEIDRFLSVLTGSLPAPRVLHAAQHAAAHRRARALAGDALAEEDAHMSALAPALDDTALVTAAQAGDMAGLGALLERHRARLHAIAVSILGHGPPAEDAVQDTFLIALRRIGELRDPAAARAWLTAILVNVCRGQLRRPSARWGRAVGPAGPRHRRAGDRRRRAARLGVDGFGAPVRAAAPGGDAALLHGRELLRGHRRSVRRSRRHRPQPAERGEGQARRGAARDGRRRARRRSRPLAQRGADRRGVPAVAARRRRERVRRRADPRRRVRHVRPHRAPRRDALRGGARERLRGRRPVARGPGHPRQRGHGRGGLARQPAPTSRCTARPPSPRSTSTATARRRGSSRTTRRGLSVRTRSRAPAGRRPGRRCGAAGRRAWRASSR